MIYFILYIILGLQTAYTTGAVMVARDADFGRDDVLVWGFFWPCIVLGHLGSWILHKDK